MTPLARTWLRRIAMGLPIVAVPLASPLLLGVSICGPCGSSTETHAFAITEAQAARILDANGMPQVEGCRAVCEELAGVGDAGASDGSVRADAGLSPAARTETASSCEVVSVDATLEARCHWSVPSGCVGGRQPAGLTPHGALASRDAGAWLARMAWMEAASVDAFDELANELASHGAPSAIVEAARTAADDERRHAMLVSALARSRGATPAAPVRTRRAVRSMLELALDNAVEGGVRETFGALLASHQGHWAADREVRFAMRRIAADEARHAMLSERIDAWARTRVDGAELDRARRAAARELEATLTDECDRAAAEALGLPPIELQRAIVRALA